MLELYGGKTHVHDARPCTTRPESDPHFPRGCGAPSSAPDLARRTWGGQVEGGREPFGAASSWRSMSASRLPDFSGRSADSCCREGPSLDSSGAATELRGGAWVKLFHGYSICTLPFDELLCYDARSYTPMATAADFEGGAHGLSSCT